MATKSRPIDHGTAIAADLVRRAGHEARLARTGRGLSLRDVGAACGLSAAEVSRIERGLRPQVSVFHLARMHAVVGLDLSLRSFPGGDAIRDLASVELLEAFRRLLHPSVGWSAEVPLPMAGDRRAWDGFIQGSGWRYGVEAETAPNDSQALLRRIQLKQRDGKVDGVILVIPASRQGRRFVAVAGSALDSAFPVAGARAVELLGAGANPGGNAVVMIFRRRVAGPGITARG
jgi:transcriptional regulator with XRE-family HTH domain